MNLSSYLQMPPAPSVPNSTSISALQGAAAGAGPSTGANLGFDFAQVMARQMVRLAPQERQELAASTPQSPAPQARTQEKTQKIDDSRSDSRSTDDARAANDASAQDNATDEPSAHARRRDKVSSRQTPHTDTDALLAELMQGAPTVPTLSPITPINTATAAPASTVPSLLIGAEAGTGDPASRLQTIELSPQMRIITDPKQAPSPESLAAFAKSMGLDESAIQNLLGDAAATPVVATDAQALSLTGITTPNALTTALGSASQGLPTGMPLNAADSAIATQMAAMNASSAPQATVASGAGLAAAATTLSAPPIAGMTPTDMAAIQQLQITILPTTALPAATLPIGTAVGNTNTPAPSTMSMLSLMGSGIDEQDVSALLSQFSQDTAGDQGSADQPPSQGDGSAFTSFAQGLARNSAANANIANAVQVAAPNMGEVYDQLSDKMATEMAARMHKQLSDGEWKMKFALRPSNLGGVEIHLEMKDGKLDAVFHADNPLTRDLLQNSSQRLREALGNLGINAGQVNVGQGGGNAQQNNSGQAGKRGQVRDNSSSQVNGTGSASSAATTRNKANASLLDLYA